MARSVQQTPPVKAASRSRVTDTATAPASSVGQRLAVTAWNIVFALALVVWAFGWTGGRTLVLDSYGDAKVKAAEQKAARAAKRAAKRENGEGRSLRRRLDLPRSTGRCRGRERCAGCATRWCRRAGTRSSTAKRPTCARTGTGTMD